VRYPYVRIPKDQGQSFFISLFEALTAKAIGDPVDPNMIVSALANALPALGPTEMLPPVLKGMIGYALNRDFWRREDIWRGEKVEPWAESTPFTPPIMKKAGQVTGLSPERMKYALEQVFTRGNMYANLVGGGFEQFMKTLPDEHKKNVMEYMVDLPFVNRILRQTPITRTDVKVAEQLAVEENTLRALQNREIDNLAETFRRTKKPEDRAKLSTFLKTQPVLDWKRLRGRYDNYLRMADIPDKRWWLATLDLSPELRAQAFATRYKDADANTKQSLVKYSRKIPGYSSPRFMSALAKARKENV
jgi:hypothetical protein